MNKQEYLDLMATMRQNEAQISALIKANDSIMKVLRENYPIYLQCLLSENSERWFRLGYSFSDTVYYHLGKCISVKEGLNYGDFEAEFEFIEGFTTNYKFIAKNGNSPFLKSLSHYSNLLYNSEENDIIKIGDRIMYNKVDFHYDTENISKHLYHSVLGKLLNKLERYSQASYNGFSCGDRIRYIDRHEIRHGIISLITGKTAYCTDGEKVSLTNGKAEHEN